MSNTKGSILISNANAVGTELVNQLGGTGYKPSEWSDAINLLGISDDNKASALAGITEGTYTGTERGAIQYSNCNAVGAMINKKFSTNRGFKPVEWESAISKLTPLSEGTVSGSICNIVNGADDVPLKNWKVTLPASLDGYSEVNGTKAGKNFIDISGTDPDNGYISGRWINSSNYPNSNSDWYTTEYLPILPNVEYTLSGIAYGNNPAFCFYDENKDFISGIDYSNRSEITFTSPNNAKYARFSIRNDFTEFMLEVGSSATTYTPYVAPTQYTVDLGRTVYGGTPDIVTGDGEETHDMVTVTADMINNAIDYSYQNKNGVQISSVFPVNVIRQTENLCYVDNGDNTGYYVPVKQGSSGETSYMWFGSTSGNKQLYWIGILDDMNMTLEQWKAWALTKIITCVYTLPTPTTFTFDPITPTPETPLGVSNWWTNEGDTEITYRKDPDIPDPSV